MKILKQIGILMTVDSIIFNQFKPMTSFGQLKNSLRRLQQLNRSMGILTKIKWSKTAIDQKQIKSQPIQFYLRLLHFFLAQYSADLYKAILDIIPNIKTLNDQKFVQAALNISRKLFSITPKITSEQLLQANKLVQKKLQLVVEIGESVYNWEAGQRKKNSKDSSKVGSKAGINDIKYNPVKFNYELDEDFDQQLQERQITIRPTQISQQQLLPYRKYHPQHIKQTNKQQSTFQTGHFQLTSKDKTSTNREEGRPNIFPKNIQNNYLEDEQEQEDQNQFYTTKVKESVGQAKNHPPINNVQKTVREVQAQQIQGDYVSREQLNEVLLMMSTLNTTVNNLVAKFNNLQAYVSNEVSKTNARISLLEQNVKIIKANI